MTLLRCFLGEESIASVDSYNLGKNKWNIWTTPPPISMMPKWRVYSKIVAYRSSLVTRESHKVSLSCFDDKRYIHDDGRTSYAYGHVKINK